MTEQVHTMGDHYFVVDRVVDLRENADDPPPLLFLRGKLGGFIVLFVVLGRRSHDEGSALGGTIVVAAPFLLAAALGWIAIRGWRRPMAVATGVTVWIITVAAGLLLRRAVFDRDVAPSFAIVSALVLGALLVGWRALHREIAPRC